jgi:hypothetical protein
MNHTESRIQAAIIKALNPYPVYAFFVKNEGKKTKAQAMRDKAMGMRSGVSDLVVITADGVVFMEVKTETGRQSKSQQLFQSMVERFGCKYVVVRSPQDALRALRLK